MNTHTPPTSRHLPRPSRRALWGVVATSTAALLLAGCGRKDDERLTTTTDTATVQRDTAAVAYNTYPSADATGSASATSATTQQQKQPGQQQDSAQVVLHEETLDVQKKQVDAGGVVVRTDVVTEQVEKPVELRKETVEVTHVSPEEAKVREQSGDAAFQEKEIFIPLTREKAVVQKDVQASDVVNVQKETETEREQVSDTVRREVAEVERQPAAGSSQMASTNPTQQSGQGLEQRIRQELRDSEAITLTESQINELEITVENNNVTLAGNVPNEQIANAIEMRVNQIDGVQQVQNELQPQDTAGAVAE